MFRFLRIFTHGGAVLIILYLASVVLANLIILKFGPSASIVTATVFIGLDLSLRDALHDRLTRLQMFGLIAGGGIITFILNIDAAQIAAASSIAFIASGLADWFVFTRSGGSRFVRSNKSNVVGAVVDSVIFPTCAFGAVIPAVIIGQFIAKVIGGCLWAIVLSRSGGKPEDMKVEGKE